MLAPVEGSDCGRAVEGELHVAGSRRLLAGGRNLLGEVGGGDYAHRKRHAVIGNEGDFQFSLYARVGVDFFADLVNRENYVFCDVVARGGLCPEYEHARGDFHVGVVEQFFVEREYVQQVEVLALVFVQALDLHVEHRFGGHLYAALFLYYRPPCAFCFQTSRA